MKRSAGTNLVYAAPASTRATTTSATSHYSARWFTSPAAPSPSPQSTWKGTTSSKASLSFTTTSSRHPTAKWCLAYCPRHAWRLLTAWSKSKIKTTSNTRFTTKVPFLRRCTRSRRALCTMCWQHRSQRCTQNASKAATKSAVLDTPSHRPWKRHFRPWILPRKTSLITLNLGLSHQFNSRGCQSDHLWSSRSRF